MTTHYHSGDEGVSKMAIHTSRFSNPELRSGKYTTVRISLGTPKWPLGYHLDAELADLMPFGHR